MHPQSRDERERGEADDAVMTGDGAARRNGPKATMTARGAVVEEGSRDDMAMSGDGAEPREGATPSMTADGAAVAPTEEEDRR